MVSITLLFVVYFRNVYVANIRLGFHTVYKHAALKYNIKAVQITLIDKDCCEESFCFSYLDCNAYITYNEGLETVALG